MIDITVAIIFHREGVYALSAIKSMRDMISIAKSNGISLELKAVLDKPDDLTRRILSEHVSSFDSVEEVDYGDPGLTRNHAAQSSRGVFLSMLDGDDLWGAEWLRLAYSKASCWNSSSDAVWHPERVFFFNEADFDLHSTSTIAHTSARSHHFLHQSTEVSGFDRNILLLNNIWTANVFAKTSLHLRYPYRPTDRKNGFGVEDWSWNIETVWNDVPHLVVPETIHLVRVKESGSLGRQHHSEGLLPVLSVKCGKI